MHPLPPLALASIRGEGGGGGGLRKKINPSLVKNPVNADGTYFFL